MTVTAQTRARSQAAATAWGAPKMAVERTGREARQPEAVTAKEAVAFSQTVQQTTEEARPAGPSSPVALARVWVGSAGVAARDAVAGVEVGDTRAVAGAKVAEVVEALCEQTAPRWRRVWAILDMEKSSS